MKNFDLQIKGSISNGADVVALHSFTFDNGRRFPASYIAFVEEFGYSICCDLFLVYIPMVNHQDSFFIRSEQIISTYQEVLDDENELWFDLGQDLTYAQLKNLVPFSMSENGHYLFWDICHGADREFDIYLTHFKGIAFTRVAGDLFELFQKLTSTKNFKGILPFSSRPLPKVFKPFDPVE